VEDRSHPEIQEHLGRTPTASTAIRDFYAKPGCGLDLRIPDPQPPWKEDWGRMDSSVGQIHMGLALHINSLEIFHH
jgi:hypothetical protein